MDGVKRCKVTAGKHTTWSEDQITYFLQLPFVAENTYYAMLVLIFALGTRPGELCGLSESDLTPQRVPTLNQLRRKHRKCLEARATDELTPEQDNNFLFVRPRWPARQAGQPVKKF